jgi:hypothetical protein
LLQVRHIAAMTTLQVNPMQLHFRAAVGADSPVTLTLFNPHPVERVAFKAGSCMQRTPLAIAVYSEVTRSGVAFVGHLLHHRSQQVPSGSQAAKNQPPLS